MSFTCKSIKTVAPWLVGMMIAGACLASVCVAADNGIDTGDNAPPIATIRPLQPFGSSTAVANVRSQNAFDLVGNLNAIDGNEITIGDRQLTLDSGVSVSGIARWTEVGVNLNKDGDVSAIEVVSDEPH